MAGWRLTDSEMAALSPPAYILNAPAETDVEKTQHLKSRPATSGQIRAAPRAVPTD